MGPARLHKPLERRRWNHTQPENCSARAAHPRSSKLVGMATGIFQRPEPHDPSGGAPEALKVIPSLVILVVPRWTLPFRSTNE